MGPAVGCSVSPGGLAGLPRGGEGEGAVLYAGDTMVSPRK